MTLIHLLPHPRRSPRSKENISADQVIALTGLSTAVSRSSGGAAWLVVTPQSYVSGAPQVKVAVTANLQSEARQQDVSFFAAADTLVLTVRQGGYQGGDGGVDNPHDIPTDQPAYAPPSLRPATNHSR